MPITKRTKAAARPAEETAGTTDHAAAEIYGKHYKHWNKKGWLGRSSSLFTTHPKWTRFLQGDFSRESAQVSTKDLKQMGAWGVAASAALGLAAKPYLKRRRTLILDTMDKMVAAGGQKWFRRLVLRVARAIYDNKARQGTTLHDSHLEKAVYEKFGEYAKRSESFVKQHDLSGYSADVAGKIYFRQLVRENIALNFNLLMRVKSKPERMEAIKYALVGEAVDELTEQADLDRLELVTDIFKENVPVINQFLGNISGQRHRALEALLSIEAKAKKQLQNPSERNAFINRVLDYYGVERRELDGYALGAYANAKARLSAARKMSPQLRREADLAELIETIYPAEILENAARFSQTRRERAEQPKSQMVRVTNAQLEQTLKRIKQRTLNSNPEAQRKRVERAAKKATERPS